jgi:hypothetical protein
MIGKSWKIRGSNPVDARDFSLLQNVKNVSVTHQEPTGRILYFFPRAKWPESTVDHLFAGDAGIKCECR